MKSIAKPHSTRASTGILAGLVGLCLNILLGSAKLVAGLISGSASILGDAANNFSDSASGVVTVTAFGLSSRKADKEHPFGHGRYEYVAGLIIGIFILVVGLQFVLTGIQRMVSPKDIQVGALSVIILCVSIAVKLLMAGLYWLTAKRLDSGALLAAAKDSIFDAMATSVVLASFALNNVLPVRLDGVCTVVVALVIVWGGVKVLKEASGKLLGNDASPDIKRKVYEVILKEPLICGAHDLIIHDYGPGKKIGSVHAEFERDLLISKAHSIIDQIERCILCEFGVELVIHIDPIDFSNPEVNDLRNQIKALLSPFIGATIHELTLNKEDKSIVFDIKLPESMEAQQPTILQHLKQGLDAPYPDYCLTINFDET